MLKVDKSANKLQIKEAVEKLLKKRVVDVKTIMSGARQEEWVDSRVRDRTGKRRS